MLYIFPYLSKTGEEFIIPVRRDHFKAVATPAVATFTRKANARSRAAKATNRRWNG